MIIKLYSIIEKQDILSILPEGIRKYVSLSFNNDILNLVIGFWCFIFFIVVLMHIFCWNGNKIKNTNFNSYCFRLLANHYEKYIVLYISIYLFFTTEKQINSLMESQNNFMVAMIVICLLLYINEFSTTIKYMLLFNIDNLPFMKKTDLKIKKEEIIKNAMKISGYNSVESGYNARMKFLTLVEKEMSLIDEDIDNTSERN